MADTLKEKTAKGIFWGAMNTGVMQVIGLVFGIVLGRLLSPEDYGLIAMITIFSAVATSLQNSGFSAAIVNIPKPTHRDYNAVFWFNVLMGAFCFVVLFFSAPLIARYYHEPRLVALCRFMFLSLFITSLGTAQFAYLFKNLKAKQQAKGSITATLVSSIVGVTMAWLGFAYWALATQTLVFMAVNVSMAWHYSDWRPSLQIDLRPIRTMFAFSSKVLCTMIATQVNNNVLNILLGRYFTAHATGCFNQASQWNSKCSYVVQNMINQVAQPVLVEMKGQPDRQLAALRKMVRCTAFIAFPLLFGLALVSHEFIVLTITEKWLESAELLQVLAVSGAILPLTGLFSSTVLSQGRSDLNLVVTATLGIAEILAMVLIWPYGIRTMVVAYTAINVLWLFVWHFFVRRIMGYSLIHFLSDMGPFAATAVAVMVATHFITCGIQSLALLLAARIVIAALLYYAVLRLARAQILLESQRFILRKKNRNHA